MFQQNPVNAVVGLAPSWRFCQRVKQIRKYTNLRCQLHRACERYNGGICCCVWFWNLGKEMYIGSSIVLTGPYTRRSLGMRPTHLSGERTTQRAERGGRRACILSFPLHLITRWWLHSENHALFQHVVPVSTPNGPLTHFNPATRLWHALWKTNVHG